MLKNNYSYLFYIRGAASDMKYNLSDRILRELSGFAQKYSVNKIILFGSRARGTNTERSDIDIAVYGGDFDGFYWDVKEKVHSLLMFDIVQADAAISNELKQEIEKDGEIMLNSIFKFKETESKDEYVKSNKVTGELKKIGKLHNTDKLIAAGLVGEMRNEL